MAPEASKLSHSPLDVNSAYYPEWRERMLLLLEAERCNEILTEETPPPDAEDDYEAFVEKDARARCLIARHRLY